MSSVSVSVVIPLYNKAGEIERAVGSVLAQTVSPEAIIVVDDGSTDSGPDLVKAIDDPRITIVNQSNAGPGAARNRGVKEAPTGLVAFLDADDEWCPGFLSRVTELHERFHDAGLWGTAFEYACGDGTRVPHECPGVPGAPEGGIIDDLFASSIEGPPLCASSMLCSKSILDEAGGFPEDTRLGEDLVLWYRIALKYQVAFSPEPLAIYHKDAGNRLMKQEEWHERETGVYKVLKKALSDRAFTYTSSRSIRRLLGAHLLDIAREVEAVGNGKEVRRIALEVLGLGVWIEPALRRWFRSLGGERKKGKGI